MVPVRGWAPSGCWTLGRSSLGWGVRVQARADWEPLPRAELYVLRLLPAQGTVVLKTL